ncbi:MAG: hypothetical protein E7513_00240 [Ruminococcaceae bacterium]|nr:hypothetical protein [Oscillospiraceae bacterium]
MIYDVIFIVIILISLFVGYKRGAARMLVSLLGTVTSFLLSVFLGDYLSKLIYDSHIAPSIIDSITQSLAIPSVGETDVFDSLPTFVRFTLSFTDFEYSDAVSAVEHIPHNLAENFEKTIAPIVIAVLSMILTALAFTVSIFLFRLVFKRFFIAVFNIPVIKTVNKLVGALCSLVAGLLFVSFIAFLLHLVMPYLKNVPYIFSESTIYNSYIFYHFYSGNIFDTIISIF